MITKITGEQPFQVLTNNFSISPSQEGYTLQISADGKQYSNLFSVGAGVTRLVTGVAANSYYRLLGNQSQVSINWVKTCVTDGGADSTELTPIDYFPLDAEEGTVVAYNGPSSAAGVYQYDGSEWIPVGSDEKTLIDFDHTSQAERASIYAELKALYDGGSGATINRNYDFYKTVNTWQGLKIEYYSFSGDTLVFGKVVSPENIDDQVVYEQVVAIDSAGNVDVVTNVVGGSPDLSAYWTSAETKSYVDSAVSVFWTSAQTESAITAVEDHIYDVEKVAASALTELHGDILELSANTPDISAYWTSAQTKDYVDSASTVLQEQIDTMDEVVSEALVDLNERIGEISGSSVDLSGYYTSGETDAAISAATAGKADAADNMYIPRYARFPLWNSQGIITGTTGYDYFNKDDTINGITYTIPTVGNSSFRIYGPMDAGTAGQILVSTGNGAPVWSAMPAPDVTKAYVDSADTALQEQIDTMDDVVSAALVDLNDRVDTKVESASVSTIWKGTTAEYDAIVTKDPTTLYIIVNNS